jgi:hypothetical protein
MMGMAAGSRNFHNSGSGHADRWGIEGPRVRPGTGQSHNHRLRRCAVDTDRSDPLAEVVAKKMMELAQKGESDPVRLRKRTLKELRS